MLKEIYKSIITQIKSKDADFITANLSKINHYDLFFNQYADTEIIEEHPFMLPAVFVQMDIDFANQGQNTQQGMLNLKLHLVQESYVDTADNSLTQADALKILDMVDMLHTTMQSFRVPQISGNFSRTRLQSEINPTNLYVYVLEYQANIDDNSTHKLGNFIESQGNHTVNVQDATIGSEFNVKLAQKLKNSGVVPGNYTI